MIHSMMKIGRWQDEQGGEADSITNFIEDPNAKGNIQKVIAIILKRHNGEYLFEGVDVEEFSIKKRHRYLYRRGSSNGPDITPTSKYAGDVKKTFRKKILKCIIKIKQEGIVLDLDGDEIEKINAIHRSLSKNEADIIEGISLRIEAMEKKEGALITLVFSENGKYDYIGDLLCFQKILKNKVREKYFSQYGKKSLGTNQQCLVCRQERSEVYGFVNTYNFYTVDKPGFVTGGFRQEDAWKNYPVCFECATRLELGKRYLQENLTFDFYGFRYLLIPKFFSDQVLAEGMEILEDIFEKRATGLVNPAGFDNTYISRLTNAEDEILELASGINNYMNFDFMFYRESKAAFNVLLHIEDILPSRFNKLFSVKKRLDVIDIFKRQISKKDGRRQLFFNFSVLRRFFPYVSKTRSYDKHFLELVGKIFSLKPIDYHFIIKAITQKFRSRFVKNEYLVLDCLAGYMLLNYLADLGVLSKGGELMVIQPIEELKASFGSMETAISEKAEIFFRSHRGFFNAPEKKACFLVGILVQKLLNIQLYEKGATPFRSKLHGLRLSESMIGKIFWEAQNKLEEYNKNYYRELESILSQYMVAGGSKWSLTNDEISFYMTLGMNLADLFKTKKEDDNDSSR